MTPDVIVVGAGVAGAAAAIRLARAGRHVVLLDRERGATHKVCGEFLSGPATAHLRALRLDPAALGGHPIRGFRLADGASVAEADLPFEAWGLSRFRLDAALRDAALEAGAGLRLGCAVARVEDAGVRVADSVLRARHVVLATGKHDLAGLRRPLAGTRRMIGFKLHLRLSQAEEAALGDRIELHFHEGGYAGLQPVGAGVANLSLVVDDVAFTRAGKTFGGVIEQIAPPASLLARRLDGHRPLWEKPLAVAGIPYGYRLWCVPSGPDWLWPIGDQATVTPSFTGDGMALAFASAERATAALLAGRGPSSYRLALRTAAARQMHVAGLLDGWMARPRSRAVALAMMTRWPALAGLAARITRIAGPTVD